MNALQRLIINAGPKVHEKIYEGWWVWNNIGFPVSHGEIMRNPNFGPGGFSPNVLVMITVRDELFPDGARPKKGHLCTLTTVEGNFDLQVGEWASGAGEVIWKFTLWDRSQNA